MPRPVYHYPYELVRVDASRAVLKSSGAHGLCCACNQHHPTKCGCPATEEEANERTAAFIADWQAGYDRWGQAFAVFRDRHGCDEHELPGHMRPAALAELQDIYKGLAA